MCTRSSSNLPVESPLNPSTSNPKRRNHRRSKQPFILEESPVDTMVDQRTMVKLLRVPTEGYAEAIMCLAAGGNTFPELRDNIYGYVSAAAVNYTQGNSVYHPLGVDNQIRPPGFAQPNVQNNQNRFGQPQGYNRGNNFNQDQSYQAPIQQNLVIPLSELEKVKRMNEANMKAMQTQINNCLAAGGNTFPELRDNIQGYVAAAAVNYNQGNFVYLPPAVILKKLPEKLRDPRKFLFSCGFNELKCKPLADLANSAICTPPGITRDVFVLVDKFTFPIDFVIFDYEIDPRVPLILERTFLWTARALIDVHEDEMILHDGDERLTLNMSHDTSSYSNQPKKESINMINICDNSSEDFLEKLFTTNHQSGNPTFSSHPKITSPEVKNDVFNPDQVLKPLFPSPILVEDSDYFLEKSDTSLSFPDYETFINHTKEMNSGSTTTHADYSLPKYDSLLFNIEPDQGKLTSVVMKDNLAEPRLHTFYSDIEEKNSGSTTIHADISLPDLECFNFDFMPDPSELTSIVNFGICENILSATNANFPPEEDHSPLFAYVVWIFISFLKHPVVPPHLFSFGNEDTIFDTGISNYHFSSILSDVSHRCEAFMKFNVYPKLVNESPKKILSSSCSLMEQ
nr:hypothetical protein [Tanacetum cinerariifolium]